MTTMTKAQPTTDLKGLIDSLRDHQNGGRRQECEDAATALESILSRQPFEADGQRLQLVACTLSPEFKRKIFTSLAMADDEQRLWNDLLTASAEEAKGGQEIKDNYIPMSESMKKYVRKGGNT